MGAVRLRIRDLSPGADQPMSGDGGRFHVCFNGELYNADELRRELEALGRPLRTASDTECIVALYERTKDPAELLSRLRGMFAIAIWDEDRRRLLLARDRLGIKPLCVSEQRGSLSFASEARALVRAGLAGGEPDLDAARRYLAWGVVPSPSTAFAGIKRLDPGSFLVWADGASTTGTYWRPIAAPDPALTDPGAARDALAATLTDAARRHLVSDRPVGCFLSGGIDSTAVATAAAAGSDVTAITVAFPGAVAADESSEAAATASALGLPHRVVPVDAAHVRDHLGEVLASLDSPSADAVNTWLACRAAADAGLVVALAGTGGDELFGGYRTFRMVPRLARAGRVIGGGRELRLPAAVPARLRSMLERSAAGGGTLPGAYAAMRGLFSPAQLARLGGMPAQGDLAVHPLAEGDAVMLLEMRHYLRDQLLADTDSVSMAHSLEVRVPLLDDEVVDLALRIPASTRNSAGKQLLVEAAGLADGRPKRPFTLPFDEWMRSELRPLIEEGVRSDALPLARLVPRVAREELWRAFERRTVHWARPYAVAALRLWPGANGFDWTGT